MLKSTLAVLTAAFLAVAITPTMAKADIPVGSALDRCYQKAEKTKVGTCLNHEKDLADKALFKAESQAIKTMKKMKVKGASGAFRLTQESFDLWVKSDCRWRSKMVKSGAAQVKKACIIDFTWERVREINAAATQ